LLFGSCGGGVGFGLSLLALALLAGLLLAEDGAPEALEEVQGVGGLRDVSCGCGSTRERRTTPGILADGKGCDVVCLFVCLFGGSGIIRR
jgi:hypothetical protein